MIEEVSIDIEPEPRLADEPAALAQPMRATVELAACHEFDLLMGVVDRHVAAHFQPQPSQRRVQRLEHCRTGRRVPVSDR
jgi:hypothetical protein